MNSITRIKIPFIGIIFLILQCSSAHAADIAGSYKSKTLGLLDIGLLHLSQTVPTQGISLELAVDSSFIYMPCGYLTKGKWEIQGDSLFLFCEQSYYRLDSLNQTGYKGKFATCDDRPMVFFIDGTLLKRITITRNTSTKEGQKVLYCLEKQVK